MSEVLRVAREIAAERPVTVADVKAFALAMAKAATEMRLCKSV